MRFLTVLMLLFAGVARADEFSCFEGDPFDCMDAVMYVSSEATPEPVFEPYSPEHSSEWTWPGYPDIEALRQHLLSDVANHPNVANSESKIEAIHLMTATELKAMHASDHERRLRHSRIPDIPKSRGLVNRQPVARVERTVTIGGLRYSSGSSCPGGVCPSGGVFGGRRILPWRR